MRLDEISNPGVSYEKAVEEAAKVRALAEIAGGEFSGNTAKTVLGIVYPGRSYNDREKDWNEAVKRQIKKQKFIMGIKVGKI